MKKRLHEAKEADIEAGIAKSLGGASLSLAEINELELLQTRDLMIDHGLDYLMAERVRVHVQKEQYRMQAQDQFTPIEGFEDTPRSLTRTYPITEHSSIRRRRQRIKKMVREFLHKKDSR